LEAIKKLPTRTIQADEVEPKTKQPTQNDVEEEPASLEPSDGKGETKDEQDEDDEDVKDTPSCAICMQAYQVGEKVRTLPCQHEFHVDCVDKWLPMKRECPLCRHDITKPTPVAVPQDDFPEDEMEEQREDLEDGQALEEA